MLNRVETCERMLTWHERHGIKTVKPTPQIRFVVIRGSRLWHWRIEKEGLSCFLARGIADTAKEAKQAAEDAWRTSIQPSQTMQQNGTIVINGSFDRRSRCR